MKKINAKKVFENFKWIARDKSGNLYVYKDKPLKNKRYKMWNSGILEEIRAIKYENEFTDQIKWEDEEPTRIIWGEPLYYIKLLDNDSSYAIRNNNTGKVYINHKQDLKHCYLQSKFTMEEIEELNPAYVPFAVPVEDE